MAEKLAEKAELVEPAAVLPEMAVLPEGKELELAELETVPAEKADPA